LSEADLFHQVAENLRDHAIWITNAERTELIYISPSFEKIWGKKTSDLYERPACFAEDIHANDLQRIQKNHQDKRDRSFSEEFRIYRSDGQIRWLRNSFFPIFNEDGVTCRCGGLLEDITDRKRAEEDLRVSEARFRSLFDSNLIGIITASADGSITEANDAFLEATGYSRKELSDGLVSWRQLTPPEYFASDDLALQQLESQGFCRPYRKEYVRKDGARVPVLIGAALLYGSKESIVGFVIDLTAQKSAEDELIRAKELSERASKTKSAFLASMSHEIRTPLTAILGFSELLSDCNQSEIERQACLATVRRNGIQLLHVVDDILDLSKIESDRLEIEKVCFPVGEVLQEVVSMLSLQAKAKKIDLIVTEDGLAASEFIISDPTRLMQILTNIIGNAVKFTDSGRIEIQSWVTHRGDEKIEIDFLIRDSGPGISPEQRAHLFQPFAQANSSIKRKYGGTGLGLVLSRKLARALGGDLILAESEPGRGTTFIVRIKSDTPTSEQIHQHRFGTSLRKASNFATEQSLPERDLSRLEILVVDDSTDNRQLIGRLLRGAGARVVFAENGRDGFEASMRGRFDVVLMDIEMPEMDGFEAVAALREKKYLGPVLALTAHAMTGERDRCLQAGFDDYLVKPIDRNALIETIANYQQPH
jgi:PAS domain S-box-containing protein